MQELRHVYLIFSVLMLVTVAACAEDKPAPKLLELADAVALKVYKSPTCGCCGKWIAHAEENGFKAEVVHPADLNGVKASFGIPPRYQSCHTAVSDEGYIFEGHIPAKIIRRFLQEKPADAIGLAVPAMPVGSPGMEVGDKFMPYQVMLLKSDGGVEVFADVSSRGGQF